MNAIEDGAKKYRSPQGKVKAVTADCITPDENYRKYKTDSRFKKRLDEAAELGLKAVEEIRGPGYIDNEPYEFNGHKFTREELYKGDIEWFLFEDQTFGMATVADMINRGYSANQVKKMIKIVDDNQDRIDPYTPIAFELINGNWNGGLEYFASVCEKINDSSKTHGAKHSEKTSDSPRISQGQKNSSLDKKKEMELAKKGQYSINFLETVQNDPVLRKGGKELQKEYSKYLDNPSKYMSEFKESGYLTNFKNRPEVRKAMAKAKRDGWSSLTESEKELLNEIDM